ncbi:hypothetical protein GCM10022243_42310 [Saccharothrix violaceirubra]
MVVSGNFATPWTARGLPDKALAEYRPFVLNARHGVPDRNSAVLETLLPLAPAADGRLAGDGRPGGALVENGATSRPGIGAGSDAVLAAPTRRHGPAVWSETFDDGVLSPDAAGALDPGTPITVSFALGGAGLYSRADRNPRVRLPRMEKTDETRRRVPMSWTARRASTCSPKPTPVGCAGGSTPASAGRRTSSSGLRTPPAGTRSSRCRRSTGGRRAHADVPPVRLDRAATAAARAAGASAGRV